MDKGREASYSKWVIAAAVVMILTKLSAKLEAAANESRVSLPDCPEKCGNVIIPYPFGIGGKCSYDPTFNLTCNQTFHPPFPTPILGENLEVLKISLPGGQIRLVNYVARECYDSSGGLLPNDTETSIQLQNFSFNNTENILAAIGCDTYALFKGNRSLNRTYTTGCMTTCNSPQDVNDGECAGAGCCETRIPEDAHDMEIEVESFFNYTDGTNYTKNDITRCSSAFVVAKDSFNFTRANLTMSSDEMPKELPVVIDWTVGNETCAAAQANGRCLCCEGQGRKCVDVHSKQGGYRCSCLPGYSGNPYLPQGCQDINECLDKNDCEKPAHCVNTQGAYYCQCPKGFQGNGTYLHQCAQGSYLTPMKIVWVLAVVSYYY